MFNPLSFLKSAGRRAASFVALDVGTGFTKAYFFDLDEGPTLLGTGRAAAGEIEKAVGKALGDAELDAANVIAVIDGAHSWLKTTTIKHNRGDSDRPIDEQELATLREKILQTAKMQATKEVFEFFGTSWDLELIDERSCCFKVDNQPVEDPVGRSGASLEAALFTAFTSTEYLEKLSADLEEAQLNLWGVSSRHLLTVKALAQESGEELDLFDAVVLDTSRRLTDVLVVFGGAIWGNRLLTVGTEDFAAGDEALGFWVSGVEEALTDFEGVKIFPERIFLVGDGLTLRPARDKLSTHPLGKTLPFAQLPKVETVELANARMQVLAAEVRGGQDEG
jgi:hypothetical protein